MAVVATGKEARVSSAGESGYSRQRPEQTLLYQLIERHYPAFIAQLAEQGRTLPPYVRREFEDFLKCGRLECGFLRVRCERCHDERNWSHTVVSGAPSAPAAVRGAWWKVRRCWSMRSCPGGRCASGY